MNTVYPTPTEYQSDPGKMADWIFSNSLLSKESQTAVFYGSIHSLDAIMKKNINNPDQLGRAAQEMYTELFEKYFDEAEVSHQLAPDPEFGNALILKISVNYKQENVWRSLSETVIYLNGKTKKLSEVING
ncbi:hypothetical protein [Serratia phage PCH45]|uniref:hypothetical protein n=1 Tax=Serratia phage PCH45 TaxID=2608368 RepID=UPI0012A81867|nr:hypothetical protein [Serratia phage PCH45]